MFPRIEAIILRDVPTEIRISARATVVDGALADRRNTRRLNGGITRNDLSVEGFPAAFEDQAVSVKRKCEASASLAASSTEWDNLNPHFCRTRIEATLCFATPARKEDGRVQGQGKRRAPRWPRRDPKRRGRSNSRPLASPPPSNCQCFRLPHRQRSTVFFRSESSARSFAQC